MFSSKTPLTLALAAVAAGVSSVHAADGPQTLPALTVSASALNQTPEQMTQPAAVLQGESWFTQRETGLADSLDAIPRDFSVVVDLSPRAGIFAEVLDRMYDDTRCPITREAIAGKAS